MTKLTYIAHDGTQFDVDAENGSTVTIWVNPG